MVWYGMVCRRLPGLTVPRLYLISSCLSANVTLQNICVQMYLYELQCSRPQSVLTSKYTNQHTGNFF